MRKVTSLVVKRAFLENRAAYRIGNTRSSGNALYLHGNKIAEWRQDTVYITTAGWNTVTTRNRLSALADVCVRKGQLLLNGKPWDGSWAPVGQWG